METNNQHGSNCDSNNCGNGKLMPTWLVTGLGGLLIAFVALLIIQKGHDISSAFKNEKLSNTISVSADGKVTAVPDLATVSVGVLSQGTSAVDVKNQNNEKVNKITAFIKSQGIDEKDIQTSQFNFYPQMDYNSANGVSKITGYQGNQSVTVKVRGVDKSQDILEKILDGVVNNGANQIDGVYFTVEKPDDLKQQARKEAIANAKVKAQELAKEAGLTLGKVVSLSESGSSGYPGIPYASDSFGYGGMMSEKSVAPSVSVGSQEITQTMTVTFELK
jgi:uncharacterized protein YggE